MTQPLALIIEDEIDLSTIFSEALKAAGYATEIISDGHQAVERLKADSIPYLIILDLHLPGVDGKGILKEMRADPRFDKTRIVIASADAAFAQTLQKEAFFVLLKPISFSQLRDLTQRLHPDRAHT
ncbi:MAG: response regulator [Chloroflexota bacterium]